jgi:hypothetical protein
MGCVVCKCTVVHIKLLCKTAQCKQEEGGGQEMQRKGYGLIQRPPHRGSTEKQDEGKSLDLSDLVPLEGEPERSGATRGLNPRDITHKPAERINLH